MMRAARMFLDAPAIAAGALVLLALGSCGGESATAPPDPSIVASVSVTPGASTLLSLNEIRQLQGNALNASGSPAPGATFSWSSSDPAIVTVNASGLATGLTPGSVTITVTAGGKQGTATVAVSPRVASITMTGGGDQGAMVGTPLDTALNFVVRDSLGSPVAEAVVAFVPAAGHGSAAPASATAGADGVVSTVWTLGTAAGTQELHIIPEGATVRDTVAASAFAGHPSAIALASGDDQSELASLALPEPIAVRVIDAYGNPVPDLVVNFALGGGGTLDSSDVLTNLDGVARTTWTLGSATGAYTATASVPDSVLAEGVVVGGGPIAFSATAVEFALGAFAEQAVAGASATIGGTGFAPTPDVQWVTVDGVAATITGGTQSSLTFTLPDFGCVPGRAREVAVTRNGVTKLVSTPVNPTGLVSIAPGAYFVRNTPGDGCIQLPANASGNDEYLVGLTATGAQAATMAFQLSGSVGAAVTPRRTGATMSAVTRATAALPVGATTLAEDRSPAGRHQAFRVWQARFFRSSRTVVRRAVLRQAQVRASVGGDARTVRIPDLATDACNDFSTINAHVIFQGQRAEIVTDASMPSAGADSLALATAMQTLSTQFGGALYTAAATWFGTPPDVDGDGRVTIVISTAVSALGVPSFSSAVDALAASVCPASNERDIIYVALPAGFTPADLVQRLGGLSPELVHELVHIIQSSRILNGGVPQAAWIEEGLAELGVEVAGFVSTGDVARSDLGAAALGGALGAEWYQPRFARLSAYFGWDGASAKLPSAPQQCSLFGFGGASAACTPAHAAGAAWSFMRYVVDRMAPTFTGGPALFVKQLATTDVSADGTALLASLTGSTLDELMVEWAMTLYVDGRVSAVDAPRLQFPSWNLADVYAARPVAEGLVPNAVGFAPFSLTGRVLGGGTSYTTISAAGAHDAIALSMRSGDGGELGSALAPRIWMVRIR